MPARFDVSPTAIAATGRLRRRIAAEQVRRVHVFVDANGESSLVVRRCFWCFVHVPREALADASVRANVRSLVDRVRSRAKVDPEVDRLLADHSLLAAA